MTRTTIHLLTELDAEELLAFEQVNRTYFRQTVPDRPDEYYDLAFIRSVLAGYEEEHATGMGYMHLVRNEQGALVGRINLTSVTRTSGEPSAANLGYRIGEAHTGRGHATRAVRLVLEAAFGPYGLHRLNAQTTPGNLASQHVLLKNGFRETHRSPGAFTLNGITHDFIHYVRER